MKRLNPLVATAVAITTVTAGLTAVHAQATPAAEPTSDPATALNNIVPTDTANLDRGLVSLRTAKGNFLSWRLLHDDPAGIEYAVYRDATRIATTKVTNYLDPGAPANALQRSPAGRRYGNHGSRWRGVHPGD
ncbi:hypothetical protein EV652_104143 [Kribbella steppae]|uniref:Rhamnogalacturonan I lyase beta-sheet domain-containing protein n=1 Tax=Kribbella steppae TaxID=2512223 RepID=A0A4R2HNC6_9ACTN|nr:hypothetical protein [Kribbella steppae]TCO32537.1 hypothetical protein EV652_104143 [Kribbella steppae]